MAHTQAWNSTFEAIPADSDDASEGAQRIRNLKRDIRERLAVDHEMELAANSTTADGRHKKITLVQQASEPTNAASEGYVYAYNNAGTAELHYMDNNGATCRLTEGGTALAFPSGTKMYFYQDTAPTGWTVDGTCADALLAVKGGSNAYNASGGTQAGTWTQPSHTHTGPSHTHTLPTGQKADSSSVLGYRTDMTGGEFIAAYSVACGEAGQTFDAHISSADGTGNTGASATAATYRPLAQVGIIATKD